MTSMNVLFPIIAMEESAAIYSHRFVVIARKTDMVSDARTMLMSASYIQIFVKTEQRATTHYLTTLAIVLMATKIKTVRMIFLNVTQVRVATESVLMA